ncbi:MAG: hypothetical protein AAF418_02575 [Pseudomonadota bacterium]
MRMIFISQIGAPGRYDPARYRHLPGGDDEVFWFRQMLASQGLRDLELCGVQAAHGEPLPSPDDGDLFVLGGSYHSTNEQNPWQIAILRWLERMHHRPLFGICGGHQLMAFSHGATIAPIESGDLAGSLPVHLAGFHKNHESGAAQAHPVFGGKPGLRLFHWANQEMVQDQPAGTRVLAHRTTVPFAALAYNHGWISTQFHPESTHQAMQASWLPDDPVRAARYRPLQKPHRLFANFVKWAEQAC